MINHRGRAGDGLASAQSLVDALAEELGRSVALDNPELQVICASAQTGSIDERRIEAIISRRPAPDVAPWLLSWGIATARTPVHIPTDPALGMMARVCIPVRTELSLVGYLWLFDDPQLTRNELSRAKSTAASLAPVLSRLSDDHSERAERQSNLVQGTRSPLRVSGAVAEALAEGLLPSDGRFRIQTYLLDTDGGSALPKGLLERELLRSTAARPALIQLQEGSITVVGRDRSPADQAEGEQRLRRVVKAAHHFLIGAGLSTASSSHELPGAHARALTAAQVDRLLGPKAKARAWEQLGGWRLLHGWGLSQQSVEAISPDAKKPIAEGRPEHIETMIRYLDAGRSVARTCSVLTIHRGTLYHRLERVRALLGDDCLDDGWRANALHVALKLHAALADHAPAP
jgi:hypothetical protein